MDVIALQAGDNFDLRSALFDLVILMGGPHLNGSSFFSFALPVAAFWAAVGSSLGLLKSTVISEGEFGIKCVRWVDFQAAHSIPLDAKPNSAAVWKSFPKSGKVLPKVRQAV